MPESKTKAAFIKPMLLLQTERLPEGSKWAYELKLDGYRALAIKTGGKVHLRSRNDNDFNLRYPAVVQALGALPDETVIDGEVVALDEAGRPSFNTLQNYGSAKAPVFYYVFDVLILFRFSVKWRGGVPLLVSVPPLRGGDFQGIGSTDPMCLGKSAKGELPRSHRLDEPAKLSLGLVASLQSPLPFHLAKSL